jgi:chemotaxis-related protein WspB
MHVVIWTSKGHRYATPSAAVVEVIPMVQSRPMPGSEPWLTGLFDYRGELLPLLDSSRLLGHDASNVRMSSRILVIRVGDETDESSERVGLIVEHVLGAERLDFEDATAHPPAPAAGIEFLGPVALTPSGTVQLTVPARLPTVITRG